MQHPVLAATAHLTNNFVSHSGKSIHFRCREEVSRLSVSHRHSKLCSRSIWGTKKPDVTFSHYSLRKLDSTQFAKIMKGKYLTERSLTILLLLLVKKGEWKKIQQQNVLDNLHSTFATQEPKTLLNTYSMNLNHSNLL